MRGLEDQAHAAMEIHGELTGSNAFERVGPSRDQVAHPCCGTEIGEACSQLLGRVRPELFLRLALARAQRPQGTCIEENIHGEAVGQEVFTKMVKAFITALERPSTAREA